MADPRSAFELVAPDLGRDLVVVDVEGNGARSAEIVELAALRLAPGARVTPADVRSWLVRPPGRISGLVTRKVHGITNDDVRDAPAWSQVADDVAAVLGSHTMVAHSASVERDVLAAHLPAWRPVMVLDTLRLARAVLPSVAGGYGLDNLIATLPLLPPAPPPETAADNMPGRPQGRPGPGAAWRRHRAAFDVWMTATLLCVLAAGVGDDFDRMASLAALPPPLRARDSDGAVDGSAGGSAGSGPQGELW